MRRRISAGVVLAALALTAGVIVAARGAGSPCSPSSFTLLATWVDPDGAAVLPLRAGRAAGRPRRARARLARGAHARPLRPDHRQSLAWAGAWQRHLQLVARFKPAEESDSVAPDFGIAHIPPVPPEVLARVTMRPEVSEHFTRGEELRFDFTERLGEIRCPVLLLAGELDPVVPMEDAKELAARLPPDCVRFVRFADAGHMLAAEQPEAVLGRISEFVLEES